MLSGPSKGQGTVALSLLPEQVRFHGKCLLASAPAAEVGPAALVTFDCGCPPDPPSHTITLTSVLQRYPPASAASWVGIELSQHSLLADRNCRSAHIHSAIGVRTILGAPTLNGLLGLSNRSKCGCLLLLRPWAREQQ